MLTYSSFKSTGRRPTSVAASLQKKEYGSASTIQTKLTVGKPNDKYEQEADRVADQVVNNAPAQKPAIQKKCASCEKEETAQRKPMLQNMEDEEVQAKPLPSIMKMEEEEVQPKLQKKEKEEPEAIGFRGGKLQLMKEDDLQTKQEGKTGENTASNKVENTIQSTRGQGSPMDKSTQTYMENGIGADFSGVRIHTDSDAVSMSRELGAHAFTTGKDVYFNSGQYRPETKSGKQLLAHELTHVVQQSPRIQMKKRKGTGISHTDRPQISKWAIDGNNATVNKRGDTLAGLADNVTGNWKDWGCIWITKMKRSDKAWQDDFHNWLEIGDTFNISNLKATSGISATIVFRGADIYLRAVQALYGGSAATSDLMGHLESISNGGDTPIENLTLAGHSGGTSMWGGGNSVDTSALNPETPAQNGIGANSNSGPKRCWFTRNARVRFTGCSSQGVAQGFSQNVLRRGASATGTNHWLCGWTHPVRGRWVTKDNPPCIAANSTGTRHATAAGLHGEPGLWVTHNGRN